MSIQFFRKRNLIVPEKETNEYKRDSEMYKQAVLFHRYTVDSCLFLDLLNERPLLLSTFASFVKVY